MDPETQLILLRTATALPFTHKAALLRQLACKFPALEGAEVEAFFEGVVDFAAIETAWPAETATTGIAEFAETETTETTKTTGIAEVAESVETGTVQSSESIGISESAESDSVPVIDATTQTTHSISPSPSPSPVVKTPSGRTLRSASTVNTNEPRRLRNSSIGTANTFNKQQQ